MLTVDYINVYYQLQPTLYIAFNFVDYCTEMGIKGFNCLSEQVCIPQEHICDGIPDCQFSSTVLATDELGCSSTKLYIFVH